jgi:hypothetical protein
MTTHAQFYLTRAAIARELADGSQLDNVKESHLRAAETWDGFAARAIKADLMRAEELKRKTAGFEPVDDKNSAAPADDPQIRREPEDAQNSRELGVF